MSADGYQRAEFPWRIAIYTVIILYLVADLFVFQGPLREKIESRKAFTEYSKERARRNQWVATVNDQPLTRRQLDTAVEVFLYRRGKKPIDLSEANQKITRRAVLQELVNDELVRQYAKAEAFELTPEAAAQAIARFEDQFADKAILESRSLGQQMTEEERRERIVAHATQQAWLEHRMGEALEITDREVRDWYEENPDAAGLQIPEVVRVRHIFLSTVEKDTPEREAEIADIYQKLKSGAETFKALAAAHSDDERTKHRGGDLGYFGESRIPEDFIANVRDLEVGVLSEPFRTALGWHVAEVLERKPPRKCEFEEVKEEIRMALEAERRRYLVDLFMRKLRKASIIEVFTEFL